VWRSDSILVNRAPSGNYCQVKLNRDREEMRIKKRKNEQEKKGAKTRLDFGWNCFVNCYL
jgi:hypothetical protein